MRALIWSEWRTKRLWGLSLLASVIVPIALGEPYTFWYSPETAVSGWVMASVLVALVFGAMAFAGELGAGAQDFLLSRPVTWKRVLGAKLIVGFGMLAGTAFVGAVVFRVLCPPQYVPFLTFAHMATGFGIAMLAMGAAMLLGMACSVVLPGAVGAVLMLLAVAVVFGTEAVLIDQVRPASMRGPELVTVASIVVPWVVGLVAAAAVVVRFGLTLSVEQRIRRYALVAVPCVVCLTVVGDGIDRAKPVSRVYKAYSYNFSPDLSHAVVSRMMSNDVHICEPRMDTFLWRAADRRKVQIPNTFAESMPAWLGNDAVVTTTEAGWAIETVRMSESKGVETKSLRLDRRFEVPTDCTSPDGKTMLLVTYQYQTPDGYSRDFDRQVRFVDIASMKLYKISVPCRGGWWQSDTEYGYIDAQDHRHVVRVKGGPFSKPVLRELENPAVCAEQRDTAPIGAKEDR